MLNPSAPVQFVLALLAMLAAFTMVWGCLMIRRYQLARLDWQREEHATGPHHAARRAAWRHRHLRRTVAGHGEEARR